MDRSVAMNGAALALLLNGAQHDKRCSKKKPSRPFADEGPEDDGGAREISAKRPRKPFRNEGSEAEDEKSLPASGAQQARDKPATHDVLISASVRFKMRGRRILGLTPTLVAMRPI